MDSSEDAPFDKFRIGPTTVVGRVIALRVLFCNSTQKILTQFKTSVADRLYKWQKMLYLLGFSLRAWLNPRSPNFLLASILIAAICLRRYRMKTVKAELSYRRKFWTNLMKTALTYEEWAHAAATLEKYNGRKRDSDLYDEDLVRAKLDDLQQRRLEGGVEDIVFALRTDLVRNLGNMCNPELHKGRLQTPRVIQEYINEVRYHLRAVCETDSEEFPLEEKLAFIHETRHAFGRTALLLSGGAALGAFHLGVVRTLIEHRLLPRVLAGASVGSVICSFAGTRTWIELQSFFDDPMPPMAFFENMGSIFATAHRLVTRGAIAEIGQLQRKMRQLIGDLTFQEAYDLSGRVLGISVCSNRRHEPPRLLNYLTSPHVVIWSAVTASCAFPGLFEAQELMAKDRHGRLVPYHGPFQVVGEKPDPVGKRHWRDGSLESDLPMRELKELFNVNHYIVSQANPHIAPLLRLKEAIRHYGGDRAAKFAHLVEMEVKHRCNQALEMGFRFWGLAKLFAQDWEGDVTIVMPATIAQFAKIIANPTPSELRKAVMQGRRCTWAKLSAISANCGIELMLDECVSDLNRRRRAARHLEAALRSGAGTGTSMGGHTENSRSGRFSLGTKRIPSWNCLARESSWGSLDEDGIAEHSLQGGPWAGPAHLHRRHRTVKGDGGSDSDSTENIDPSMLSWTRAGGPLMRTASAAKLALLGGIDPDDLEGSRHSGEEAYLLMSGPAGSINGSNEVRHGSGSFGGLSVPFEHRNSWGSTPASSMRRGKMWERITGPVSPGGPTVLPGPIPPLPDGTLQSHERDEREVEGHSFGLAMCSGLSSSPPHNSSSSLAAQGSQILLPGEDGVLSNSHRPIVADHQGMGGSKRQVSMQKGSENVDGEEGTCRGGHMAGCSHRGATEYSPGVSCSCMTKKAQAIRQIIGEERAPSPTAAVDEGNGKETGEEGWSSRADEHCNGNVGEEYISGMGATPEKYVRASPSPFPSTSPSPRSADRDYIAESGLREMLVTKLAGQDHTRRPGSGQGSSGTGDDAFGSFMSRSSSLIGQLDPTGDLADP